MGIKRSVLTDEKGLPLAVVISGANTHDVKLLTETLDNIVVVRPEPSEEKPQKLCFLVRYEEEKHAVEAILPVAGIGENSAKAIIAVIGTDMSRFPTDAHISSWAGLCPGDNESAKKRKSSKTRKGNSLLRTTLVVCAHAAAKVKNSYFYAQFHRISAHRGKKRAYVAVAHSMLIAIYHILKDGVEFRDLGAEYYNQFNKERKINAYLKKLKALGWKIPAVMVG